MLTGPPPKFHGTRDILLRGAPRLLSGSPLWYEAVGQIPGRP